MGFGRKLGVYGDECLLLLVGGIALVATGENRDVALTDGQDPKEQDASTEDTLDPGQKKKRVC